MMAGVENRKIQWAISLLLVMLYFYGLPTQAQYGGGTGEPNDPYLIYTAEQMNAIGANRGDWDKHFKLMADIDLSSYTETSFNIIGIDWNNGFTGVFDGNGHAISHLRIEGRSYLGLFGQLASGAEVKNLGLVDVNITGLGNYVGGLVGINSGSIATSYSTGTVTGNRQVGGLVGINSGSIATSYSTGTVSGGSRIGGLVGRNNGRVTGSYSAGLVSEKKIFVNEPTRLSVTGSYSAGLVSGIEQPFWPRPELGGLVGVGMDELVAACFWDIRTSGQAKSAGGAGKTTAEMQMKSTFTDAGWDFVAESVNGTEDIWRILEGLDYPRLWWQPEVDVVEQVSPPLRGESGEMILGLGTLEAAVYSPDGKYIATAGSLGVFLWDAETGAFVRTLIGHTGQVWSMAFSPDGTRVLTGSWDRTAKLWDAETGEDIRTFGGHTDYVLSVAFSPDGTRVLTGNFDNTVRLWDVETGQEIHTFLGHTDYVVFVAFSQDGMRVLTGSRDKTAKLWDAETGQEIRTFGGHASIVTSVAFSPDGTRVLTGNFDHTVRLWDAETGQEIRTFLGHTDYVHSVAFSPDGKRVLTGSRDKTAKLWDAETGQEIRTFIGHTSVVSSVAFSPDGTRVLTGSWDGTARIWELVQPVPPLPYGL